MCRAVVDRHDYLGFHFHANHPRSFYSRAVLESDISALLQSAINIDYQGLGFPKHNDNVIIKYYQPLSAIRSDGNWHKLGSCAHKYHHMDRQSSELHAALPDAHSASR